MCVGTCTASDIWSYNDAFLMNIQNFLFHPPKDSIHDKNSLMSLINHTFFQHNHPHYMYNQQSQHDVLFACVVATNYILCTKCPPKTFPIIPKKPSRGLTMKEIQRRSNHLFKNMVCIARRNQWHWIPFNWYNQASSSDKPTETMGPWSSMVTVCEIQWSCTREMQW